MDHTRSRLPPSSTLLNVMARPLRFAIWDMRFCMKKTVFNEGRWVSSSSGMCLIRLKDKSSVLNECL